MMIQKIANKYVVIFSIGISFLLLSISSLFAWDDNPVMGWDKLCADVCIVLCCILLIRLLGLQDTAGFAKNGYIKGLLYGSPFLVIGIASAFVSNAGVDFSTLIHISAANTVLFTINMLFVGMNEEIWMRALILNALMRKYGDSYPKVWKCMEMTIQQAVVIIALGSLPPILIAWLLLRQRNEEIVE